METLKPFETDDQALVQKINQVIGSEFISQSANFVEAFNRDVQTLNKTLEEPPSYKRLIKKGIEIQDEFNALQAVSEKRWDKSDKQFEVGANAIRNLAAIRKEYNEAFREVRSFEAKRADVQLLCMDGPGTIWQQFANKARQLDTVNNKNRVAALAELKEEWQQQQAFALFDSGDIIHYLDELYDFKWFLDLMKKALVGANLTGSNYYAICLENEQVLATQEERLYAAMALRLKAASKKQNLYYDDAYQALAENLADLIGERTMRQTKMLQANRAQTYGLGPSRYLTLSRILLEAKDPKIKDKLYQSFWLNNDTLPLKLVRHGDDIVPAKIQAEIPLNRGWSPLSWIRYYFFKVSRPQSPFWEWMRQLLVGNPSHALVIVNDTVWQLRQLKKDIKTMEELKEIIQHPGFKASLSIDAIIAHERERIDRFKLPWFLRIFLNIPFFHNATTRLIDGYLGLMSDVEQSVHTNARSMVEAILKKLDKSLKFEIHNNLFMMPKNFLGELHVFVSKYGTPKQKALFKQYTSPMYLLKNFKFFKQNESNPYFRELNQDAVDAFLRYAEKYWTGDEIRAAYYLMDVVTGANLPQNKNEEQKLAKNLLCMVNEKNAREEVFVLLQWVAGEIVARCGDLGNPLSYRFLKRFAPDRADIWKDEKEAKLDDKFTEVVSLFRKSNGHEVDLKGEALTYQIIRKYIHDLTFDPNYRKDYLPAIARAAQQYLDQYNGTGDNYTIIFYWVGKVQGDLQLFYAYFNKRLEVVFGKDRPMQSAYEYSLLAQLKDDEQIQRLIRKRVETQYVGQSIELESMLKQFGHEPIRGLYLAKRFIALFESEDYSQIQEETSYFDSVSMVFDFQEPVSIHLSHMVQVHIADGYDRGLTSRPLHDMIEKYGNEHVKETYRLARIEQLFRIRDKTLIDEYMMQLKQDIGSNDLSYAFSLPQTRNRLQQLFMAKANQMISETDWHGNWQYIMEHFDLPGVQNCIFRSRLAWLNEFMFETEQFAQQGITYRNTQDLNVHFKNSEIPTDKVSMADFFGRDIKQAVSMCLKRIDKFDLSLDDQVLHLLDRYFQDVSIRISPRYFEYRKKIGVLKKARKFNTYLEKGNYDSARIHLDKINEEHFALQTKQITTVNPQQHLIIQYQKNVIQQMEYALEECYRRLAFPTAWLSANHTLGSYEPSPEIEAFEEALLSHRETVVVDSLTGTIKKNRQAIGELIRDLIEALQPEKLDTLNFSPDSAQKLHIGLSLEMKQALKNRFAIIIDNLSFDEHLSQAARAFFRIVMGGYTHTKDKQADIRLLKSYRAHPIEQDSLVNSLMTTLAKDLEQAPWDSFDKVIQLDSHYLKSFLSSAPQRRQKDLASTLIKHMGILYEQSDMTQLQEQQAHWVQCGRLYHILLKLGAVGTTQKKAMSHMLALAQETCQGLIGEMVQSVDDLVVRQSLRSQVTENEQSMFKHGLFLRVYGDKSHKAVLDDLLLKVSRWQRIEVMAMDKKPIEEHRLNFSFDLIQATANEQMQLSNARLQRIWSIYQGSPTQVNSKKVQRQALLEVIPEFNEKINQTLFRYFVEKFSLKPGQQQDAFYGAMKQMREALIEGDALVELEDIRQRYPLSVFKQALSQNGDSHNIFSKIAHKATDRHARHLMVALHLSVRSAQLAKLWAKNLKTKSLATNRHFSTEILAKPLLELLNQHREDWEIMSINAYNSMKDAILAESNSYKLADENEEIASKRPRVSFAIS